jgi:hypothetical protein
VTWPQDGGSGDREHFHSTFEVVRTVGQVFQVVLTLLIAHHLGIL